MPYLCERYHRMPRFGRHPSCCSTRAAYIDNCAMWSGSGRFFPDRMSFTSSSFLVFQSSMMRDAGRRQSGLPCSGTIASRPVTFCSIMSPATTDDSANGPSNAASCAFWTISCHAVPPCGALYISGSTATFSFAMMPTSRGHPSPIVTETTPVPRE